eukprot:GCRY01001352.1.p1 GENE.GCRY01001352.1~~GCRY01001352.1.p1  ORF type:complete len:360 (+),score=77.70 GCRY01001352.1:230-1309(+)
MSTHVTPEDSQNAVIANRYTPQKMVGNGSFGVVYLSENKESGEVVAIKKVLQDRKYKNRELEIMLMLSHPNVVAIKEYFYSKGDRHADEIYLNVVMEFVPDSLHRITRNYNRIRQQMPLFLVKLYSYQLFRGLAYCHTIGVCHRDIKPQNVLVNPETGELKLCDFGSAKQLRFGEPNVAYICSRYYRAPELIFGAQMYTHKIDVWSAGCVLAELVTGVPLFPGDNGVDQLVEIIKILGTPTKEQISAMNEHYCEFQFPSIRPHPWPRVFKRAFPLDAATSANENIQHFYHLISKLLVYKPMDRFSALEACAHPFYNELRDPAARLPNGRPLPTLFDFTEQELSQHPHLRDILVPPHTRG